jgi:hypothetical protein
MGIIGFRRPELGGRTWGSVEEVRNDPVKVGERTRRRNKQLSVIILLFGVVLLILVLTQ